MKLVKVEFHANSLEVEPQSQSVVVKDICENIGLKDYQGQQRKLKSNPSFQSKLIKVQTAGGMQEVFTIPLSKLNGWLFSINPNKVKPEVKQKLIDYQNECFDVLHDYFNKGYAMKPELQEALEFQIKQHEDTILSQNKMIAQGSSSGPSQENFRILMSEHEELQVENYLLRKQNMKMTQFIESFQTQSQNMIASVQTLKAISH